MWVNTILPTLLLLTTGLALLINNSVICDPYPWAENVCNKSIPIKKDIVIKYPVQYEIKVQSMCGILPCEKTRKETRTDEKIKSIVQYVDRPSCCPGYTETPDRRCAPICLESCNNGKCVAPNVCKCQPEPTSVTPGFVGPTCGRFVCLTSDKWGSKCDRDCNCSGNSYCSADTGKCLCYPGWQGTNCTLECDPDSDSADCEGNNKLPPIMEPDANLMNEHSAMMRQKPEALVLDDDVKITADRGQDWSNVTSMYLLGILSVVSMVLLVAFLFFKRRYEQVRNELYYSAAASSDGGSNYSGSGSSPYSYYTTGRTPSSLASGGGPAGANLEKNLSFTAATRHILLGKDINSKDINSLQAQENGRKKMVLHPRVESNLIKSQKQAKQNFYSDTVLNMDDKCGGHKEQPSNLQPVANNYSVDDHIYQVPKSTSASRDTTRALPLNPSLNDSNEIYDDSSSNIYEEIKPRT